MNSRDRILYTIKKHQYADKIPWTLNFGAIQGINPTLLSRYKEYKGIKEHIFDYLDYDIVMVQPPEITGSNWLGGGIGFLPNGIIKEEYYDAEKLSQNGYLDAWGIYNTPWEMDPTFIRFDYPLKKAKTLKEIEQYPSPRLDEATVGTISSEASAIKAKAKMSTAYSGSVYEWCWNIRGQEEFMIDMYDNPDFVEALVDKVSEFTKELCLKSLACGIDVISCYDDFGMQTSLQISPKHWRRFIKPAWKKVWDAIRKVDPEAIIFLHSCGCIEEIIPDLIEIGLDVIHPLQPETMDIYNISEKYRNDIAIWGTVSTQHTMPLGTPREIDAEIKDRIDRIGKKGSFILSPANILGPDVPLDNIEAFIQSARKYC